MRKTITALASAAALGLAAPVIAADELSYSFVELGYVNSEIDDSSVDADGFGVRGSYGFTRNLHGFAEYDDLELDTGVGFERVAFGAGVHWPVTTALDVVGSAAYLQYNFDGPGPNPDGFALGVGLRGKVMEALELRGGVTYENLSGPVDAEDTTFGLGARFYVTQLFALGADVAFDDDGTTWTLGAHFDFGR